MYGNMEKAMAGMSVDSGFDSYRESGRVAETGAIAFGTPVFKGSADSKVKIATATTDKFRGIAVKINNGSADGTYAVGEAVTYMRKGRIWAKVSATGISADEAVYVDMADAEKRLTNDPDGTDNLAISAVFRSADENGLCQVEINLP
jgi:hypothetical protein